MIGIIAAMQIEMEKIASVMESKSEETVGGVRFVLGKIYNVEAVCAVCGIGKVFASMCTQAMIVRYSPELIINTGIGGTLSDKMSIGDIAIAENVCQHDLDTTELGDEPGLISGIGRVFLAADLKTLTHIGKIAAESGLKTVTGTIASGDQFVGDASLKDRIKETFGAIACDMESGAVGQTCYLNKVPFAIIRAISDNADGSACEDYPSFAVEAANRSANLVTKLIREIEG